MPRKKKLKPSEITQPLASAHTIPPKLMSQARRIVKSGDPLFNQDDPDTKDKDRDDIKELTESGEYATTQDPHRLRKIGRDA